MSADRDVLAYLGHMRDAAAAAMSYVGDRSLAEFQAEPMRVDATVRQLEILGEAASQVDGDFRDAHPDIPWRKAVATRNVLIHDYASVLPEVVWRTVRDDLPALVEALAKMVR